MIKLMNTYSYSDQSHLLSVQNTHQHTVNDSGATVVVTRSSRCTAGPVSQRSPNGLLTVTWSRRVEQQEEEVREVL